MSRFLKRVWILSAFVSLVGVDLAAQQYTIRRLTAPGLARGVAYDIDNQARIVGEQLNGAGLPQPVVWINGVATLLPVHSGGTEGSVLTIDDSGRMGGKAGTSSTPTMGTVWELGGSMFEMGVLPGDVFSKVNGVNGGASATGSSDSSAMVLPIVWTTDADIGQPVPLPLLPGYFEGEGMSITATDLVVGYLWNGSNQLPVTWSNTGAGWALTALPSLGPSGGMVAVAISNTFFLGSAIAPGTGLLHFVAWVGGAIVDLGTLPGQDCGILCGNAAGDAAGWSRTFSMPPYVAVLKRSGQPIVDLNTLLPPQSPWLLTAANGMNDAGAIVGSGVLNGFPEAFVMIPTSVAMGSPVPGTAGTNNTFTASGATPNGTVFYFVAVSGGEATFPGCLEGLDLASPLFFGAATANATGTASLTIAVPGSLAGIPLLFQSYDPAACHTSNVVQHTF